MLLASQKREIDAISHGDSGHLDRFDGPAAKVYGEGVPAHASVR
jgi:hypothetical protein